MRAFASFIVLLFIASATVSIDRPATTLVPDISWPNCGNRELPSGQAGIVGLTGGLSFHPNPCLGKENRFNDLSVYVNSGYPGIKRARDFSSFPKRCAQNDEPCLAYNYGYNSIIYARDYGFKNGVIPHRLWLDVEFGNTWSDNASINVYTLQGMIAAAINYVGRGNVGIYSYPFQWGIITKNWRVGLPAWVATGSTDRASAEQACQSLGFTGIMPTLAQYTASGLDQNLVCRP